MQRRRRRQRRGSGTPRRRSGPTWRELRASRNDEPPLPDDGWFHYGDDPLWIVGRTSAGFPYGPTRTEMQAALEWEGRRSGWFRAKTALRSAFASRFPQLRAEVGRVRKLGEGLSRDVYHAYVELSPDPDALSGAYVAQLLSRRDEALAERTLREADLLARLWALSLPFRVPRVLSVWTDGANLALVRSALPGVPLDLRAGRQGRAPPWEIVGQLAAAVHALDREALADLLPGDDTRRAHAAAWLSAFEGDETPELRAALAWAREHLPPDEPSAVIHGDLLGQNVLLDPSEPPGLIDWEYARLGDPAYDLAIVTRGVRRPFQAEGGMRQLLEAYARAGGAPLDADAVRFYELGMAAAWYRESLRSKQGDPPDQCLGRVQRLLRWVGA